MALITGSDLALFLNRSDLDDDPRADLFAELASGIIFTYLKGDPSQAVVEDLILDGPARGSNLVILPGFPVTEVAKVETLCVASDGTETWTEIEARKDFGWSSVGILSLTQVDDATTGRPYLPRAVRSLRVSYTRGSEIIPAGIRAIALGLAGRMFLNPSGKQSETIGGYSYNYGSGGIRRTSTNMTLDVAEQALLGSFTDYMVG